MKIAHVPFGYYPDVVGGTEVYVHALARAQQAAGHEVVVIAPADANRRYEHDGVPVYRYAVQGALADISELYAAQASVDAAAFAAALREAGTEVLHVHGFGRAVTAGMVRAAKRAGCKVLFTYHTPTATCMRGTLMQFGTAVCRGALDPTLCAACTLHSKGLHPAVAGVVARLPATAGRMARQLGVHGRVGTALRMRELVSLRHAEIRAFLAEVDHIIATSAWVAELLENLGVDRARITLNRQGLAHEGAPVDARAGDATVRLVFLGRIDRTKGLHVLIDALSTVPDAPLELHIYGMQQHASADAYRAQLQAAARRDARIHFHEPVPADRVPDTLGAYDVLVAPSQWLETGPLVVLEAFAAGLPVLGSRLGGIAELVTDEVDGLLVEAGSRSEWARALRRITDADLRTRLRRGVRRPRTMLDVAREMDVVYESVA